MAGIPDYSTTAASNASVGSVNFAEGQAPSTVNDSARALMADLAAEATLETVSGTDTYTVTYDIVPSAYSTKMRLWLLFTNANTSTTPTLNVNSLGAKTIVDHKGNALAVGAISASSVHHAIYDGTNIRLVGTVVGAASATTSGIVELATDAETVTGTDTARVTTPANITAKMAAPGTIGGTTAAAATFTTLTATTLGGALDLNSQALTNADINSGTVDGAIIGGSSAAAATFTNLTATGTITVPGVPTVVKNTSDQTNATTTLTNATSLGLSVSSGSYYYFKFFGRFESSASTAGLKLSVTTPTFGTRDFAARVLIDLDSGTETTSLAAGSIIVSGGSVVSSNVAGADTAYNFSVEGTIKPTANGTVQLQFAAEAAGTVTLHEGSCGFLYLL